MDIGTVLDCDISNDRVVVCKHYNITVSESLGLYPFPIRQYRLTQVCLWPEVEGSLIVLYDAGWGSIVDNVATIRLIIDGQVARIDDAWCEKN